MSGPCFPSGDRFALSAFADGSVLVDLETGAFYRLQGAADRIGRGLAENLSPSTIAENLAAEYRIPLDQAHQDVQTMLAQLQAPPVAAGPNPISFRATNTDYTLCWQGQPLYRIDPGQRRLHPLTVAEPGADIVTELLWAVPHLLLLANHFVLHASAILDGELVTAFCGPSGLGKTTLAQRFAAHGCRIVSEDLLVVRFDGDRPMVVLGAEERIRRWASAMAPALTAGQAIDTAPLLALIDGEPAVLREVFFPRRSSTEVSTFFREPLGQADAFLMLLENSFAELGQRSVWLRLLEANRRLVQEAALARFVIPEGLSLLEAAVMAYRAAIP
jgi:hypothetical protein